MVQKQLDAVFSDFPIRAVKIGMLWDAPIIEAIIEKLPRDLPIVVDPVMGAKGGCSLLKPEAMSQMKRLFSFSTLITPNLPEASLLLGWEVQSYEDMEKGASQLLELGAQAVLVKGGHLALKQGADCLATSEKTIWFESPKVWARTVHGTGCVFSSAITAFLAQGENLEEAVRKGKAYLQVCLEREKEEIIGRGNGPVKHVF
jgi:hydroxymethylpyrimidine kinase/phosphomethylpyrimidine kinase